MITLIANTTKCEYEPSGFQRRPVFTVHGTVSEHGTDHVLYEFSIVVREGGDWDIVWVEPTDYAVDPNGDEIEEYADRLTTVLRNQIVLPIVGKWERDMQAIRSFVENDEMHIVRGLA